MHGIGPLGPRMPVAHRSFPTCRWNMHEVRKQGALRLWCQRPLGNASIIKEAEFSVEGKRIIQISLFSQVATMGHIRNINLICICGASTLTQITKYAFRAIRDLSSASLRTVTSNCATGVLLNKWVYCVVKYYNRSIHSDHLSCSWRLLPRSSHHPIIAAGKASTSPNTKPHRANEFILWPDPCLWYIPSLFSFKPLICVACVFSLCLRLLLVPFQQEAVILTIVSGPPVVFS